MAILVCKELRAKKDKGINPFSEEDMANLEKIVEVLKPMDIITNILCEASTPTVSLILPLVDKMLKGTAIQHDDSELLRDMKTAISADIGKRYAGDIREFLLCTTALDARFRSMPFISENEKHSVFSNLVQKAVELCRSPQQVKKHIVTLY